MKQRIHNDIIIGIFLVVVSIILYNISNDFPPEGRFYPKVVLIILFMFGVLITFDGLRKSIFNKSAPTSKDNKSAEAEENIIKVRKLKLPFIVLILSILYVFLISFLGFFVSTIIFLVTILLLLKVKKVTEYLYAVIGTNIFLYLLFVKLLNVSLPEGLFF